MSRPSALDVHSENLIRTTLLELKEHMTVIIIAHRLSTLDICDRIMVIQEGRIVGFDSPDRLEASNAFLPRGCCALGPPLGTLRLWTQRAAVSWHE